MLIKHVTQDRKLAECVMANLLNLLRATENHEVQKIQLLNLTAFKVLSKYLLFEQSSLPYSERVKFKNELALFDLLKVVMKAESC